MALAVAPEGAAPQRRAGVWHAAPQGAPQRTPPTWAERTEKAKAVSQRPLCVAGGQRSVQRASGFGAQKEATLADRRDRKTTLGCHRRNSGPVVAEQSVKAQLRRLATTGPAFIQGERDRIAAMSNVKEVRKSAAEQARLDHYLTWAEARTLGGCELFTQHQAHGPLPVTEPVAYAFLKILYKLDHGISRRTSRAIARC